VIHEINVSQLGIPKHTPYLYLWHKQDQPVPLLSPSKLGLQASNTWDPVSVWCFDLHLIPTPKSRSGNSQNLWQESSKSSRFRKQVHAQDNKSMTWLPSTATDSPQLTQAGWVQQSLARLANQVQIQSKYSPTQSPIIIHLYSLWLQQDNSNNNIFPISREWQVITRLLPEFYIIASYMILTYLENSWGKDIYANEFHLTPLNLMHKYKVKYRIIRVMHRGLPG
jgi:hypothetical protein